jgi:hypothetical protein
MGFTSSQLAFKAVIRYPLLVIRYPLLQHISRDHQKRGQVGEGFKPSQYAKS